jgi:hypothetical protein
MAELVKKNGQWEDTKPTEIDWDFFEKFEQWLKDYKVQFRVLKEAGKGKPWASVQSGNERYVFFKIEPKLWAIQRPGNNWLDVVGDWAFWFDFDSSVWIDRRMPQIRKIETAGVSAEDKIAAMKELSEQGWSRAVQDFYQRRMLDKDEDMRIRTQSLEKLRNKPSWRNIRAEMELLQSDPPDNLLKEVTASMRSRNPKGPLYHPGGEKLKVIQEWTDWWNKNSNRKD